MALALSSATAYLNEGNENEGDRTWEYFDECCEHAAATKDDETIYSEGLQALRGLPLDMIRSGLKNLNNAPVKSTHARRTKKGFGAVKTIIEVFLKATAPTRDEINEFRTAIASAPKPRMSSSNS